jgi:hypothetical protein
MQTETEKVRKAVCRAREKVGCIKGTSSDGNHEYYAQLKLCGKRGFMNREDKVNTMLEKAKDANFSMDDFSRNYVYTSANLNGMFDSEIDILYLKMFPDDSKKPICKECVCKLTDWVPGKKYGSRSHYAWKCFYDSPKVICDNVGERY